MATTITGSGSQMLQTLKFAMSGIFVTVYPTSVAQHVSQIYTGLIELHRAGKIRLYISEKPFRHLPEVHEHLLWTSIRTGADTTPRTVCFDMRDGGQTIAENAVDASDIYFKRSFDPAYVRQLSNERSGKIRPYGLNYACRSSHMRKTLEIHHIHRRIHRQMEKHEPYTSVAHIARHMASLLLSSRFSLRTGSLHLPESFEAYPNQAAEKRILFLTRAWDPSTRPPEYTQQFTALNDMRADTIRALRRHFGDRFTGGLKHTSYAKKHYPDCIAAHNTKKENYLATMKRCLITVTTTGLYGSIGWKLPEYLAASRCIVTEPLLYELPSPLQENKNLITFSNPEQCVSACERLLENPALSASMREENFRYYNAEVKPAALLFNRIQDVLGKGRARPAEIGALRV